MLCVMKIAKKPQDGDVDMGDGEEDEERTMEQWSLYCSLSPLAERLLAINVSVVLHIIQQKFQLSFRVNWQILLLPFWLTVRVPCTKFLREMGCTVRLSASRCVF